MRLCVIQYILLATCSAWLSRRLAHAETSLLVKNHNRSQQRAFNPLDAGGTSGYMVPLMMHGPNNQINAIKETLALAHVLGRTLVLPDLQSHQFTDKNEAPMRFADLFDVDHLKSHFNTVLLEDLPALLGGAEWSRQMDAVLLLVRQDQVRLTSELVRALGLVEPPRKLWLQSPVTSWRGCTEAARTELRELLAPHRVVAVQTFHGLLFGSQWLAGPLLMHCTDACCTAYKTMMPYFRKSPAIYKLAERFIQRRLSGGRVPYVAAHIRPYPDPCVKIWTQDNTPERTERMKEYCNNDYLLYRFAPSIQHLMKTYNTTTVFIMTHPRIRSIVQTLLREAGIEPIFMELADVMPEDTGAGSAAGNVSFSMLAMVEEAVCTRAVAFVGTKESSMTGTIVQERLAHGLSPATSYTFFRRAGYEQRPIAVDAFYNLTKWSTTGSEKWRNKIAAMAVEPT